MVEESSHKSLTVEGKSPGEDEKGQPADWKVEKVTGQGLPVLVHIYAMYLNMCIKYIYPVYIRSLKEQLTRVPLSPKGVQNKLP